jgi:hypothetical protein
MSYPVGVSVHGEDRLAVLSQARPWALSDEALVAGFDALTR